MNEKYILVGIDGSQISESLVQYAAWLAQSNGMKIMLIHTIEHNHLTQQPHHEGNLTPNIRSELLKELSEEERQNSKKLIAMGKELIQAVKEKIESIGVHNVEAKLRHGTLPEAIADLKDEIALVMLGSKGTSHGREDKGLGNHLEESIRATNTPIFIAQTVFKEPKKVLFAYNGSPTSKRALDMIAQDTIYKEKIEIHVVCINKDKELALSLVTEAKAALAVSNASVITQVLSGDTIYQLTNYQKQNDIDITAMGAFSHGKLHGFFFGSFTTKMIQKSDTNFLLIR